MFCTKCGTEIKDGFKFCPKCGAPAYVKKDEDDLSDVSTSKKVSTSASSVMDYVPNPLIDKELMIDAIKKYADLGVKEAIHRQAFRYEMGIGVEKDIEKAKELYSKSNRRDIKQAKPLFIENCDIIAKHLCVSKKQNELFLQDRNK